MNYIRIDTETANGLDCPLTYDIAWTVFNDDGETLAERAFVVTDVFAHERELMKTAYYAEKIPTYYDDLTVGLRKLAYLKDIRKALADDYKNFNAVAIIAHNARFDYLSCTTTQRYTTKSKYRYFYPYGAEIWDTLKMAQKVFYHDEDYRKFCFENGFVTKHKTPRPQLKAEVLYRYITNNTAFEETHKGLEDTSIEKEIFLECIRRNPTVERKLWKD